MKRAAANGWLIALVPGVLVAMIAGVTGEMGLARTVILVVAAIVTGALLRLALPTAEASGSHEILDVEPRSTKPAVLRPPSELFESVLGTMIDGVVVVDGRLSLLYVNRAARNLLDLGERRVTGRLISEASRSAPLQDVIETTLRTRTHQRTELQLTRQKLTLAVSAAPLDLDPAAGILIVLHDVTELRRLERMRREFVSNVSHELKTPLTSIQAYADTLMSGGLEDEANNRSFVERISEQAERLQTLILDLLRLARIESDEVAFEIGSVDVGEVISECVEDRADLAAAKGLSLVMKPPPRAAVAKVEPEGLRTILSNLIENGLNYTPAGGQVTVAWAVHGSEVKISVSDTGVGIPREHQARVFERFYRVDRARSRALGGTGLGLAIVKHLVQAFNGRVELESEQGRGSNFIVWVPLGDSQALESSGDSSPEP
jgi:two-component system, OmpR family, phosphate regulon sensor histidine kinase PhoR